MHVFRKCTKCGCPVSDASEERVCEDCSVKTPDINPRIDDKGVGWCVRGCPHKRTGPFYTYICGVTGKECTSLCLPHAHQREARIKELEDAMAHVVRDADAGLIYSTGVAKGLLVCRKVLAAEAAQAEGKET